MKLQRLVRWSIAPTLGMFLIAVLVLTPSASLKFVLPAATSFLVAGCFLLVLSKRASDGLISEIGALYVVFLVAYTVGPAFTFVVLQLDMASGWVWDTLADMLPSDVDLALHLWRLNLFTFGFCSSYLLVRNAQTVEPSVDRAISWDGRGAVIPFTIVILIINLIIIALSAPVEEYIDHYRRYEHLSPTIRMVVSIISRLESGLYLVTLTLAFINFRKYSALAVLLVLSAFVFKIWNSQGSRIESLFVLLMAVCLSQLYVRKISALRLALGAGCAALLYSLLETLRAENFSVQASVDTISTAGLQPASELGAVFFASFHLYAERAAGTLPEVQWPMFFNDFISLVLPNSDVRFNPQHWYARNYFPTSEVPPQTNGPVADSALWGGEIDLFLRALLNGIFFAWLANTFFAKKYDWRMAAIYVFCYSTCVMSSKYSVLYHLNPLVKTVIPIILLTSGLKGFLRYLREPGGGSASEPNR